MRCPIIEIILLVFFPQKIFDFFDEGSGYADLMVSYWTVNIWLWKRLKEKAKTLNMSEGQNLGLGEALALGP